VSGHKFEVGQTVRYIARFNRVAAAADFKVTQLLPAEDDDYQYRTKTAAEPHERMVKESQLQRESN
jgi:hypothetical protein